MPAPSTPVVHLELHTGDLRGASGFYAGLCGWPSERIQAGDGSYVALDLGGLGGGMVECGTQRSLWLPYVEVPDIAAATDRARRLRASGLLGAPEGPAGRGRVVSTPARGGV